MRIPKHISGVKYFFLSILIWILLGWFSLPVISQSIVTGVVLDNNNRPISEVDIKVKNFNLAVTSDSLGNFEIFVPPNKFLELIKEGYFTKSLKITQSLTFPLKIRLKKNQSSDNIVLVKGTVIDFESQEPLIGASVFSQDFTTQTLTDSKGQFELEVIIGSAILLSYGRTESFLIEYGGDQVFELFKPAPTPSVGNQMSLEKADFNKGNIHHPLQLLQSRVPGLMMSRGGGNNPFGQFHTRIHGLSSFNGEQPSSNTIYTTVEPLLVVDGVPATNISILDPLSIESVKIIKDGTAAQYGMRGASGVIEINTNSTHASGIQYHTFLGIDHLDLTMPFVTAEDYQRNAVPNGDDQGFQTDWFEEVSRKAHTHMHHLSLAKQKNGTAYQLSFLYKDAEGILKKQGYQRLQVNGHFQQSAFEEKLKLTALLRGSTQEDNYSQPLAFRYAQSYNPTSPIIEEGNEFGGYYEQALFDYFNPVAMLELNPNIGEQQQFVTKLSAEWQVFPTIYFSGTVSKENYQSKQAEFVSKNSFWRGVNSNGFASQNKVNIDNHFYNTHLAIVPLSSVLTSLKIGHQYQIQQQRSLSIEGGDFLTDAFTFNNLSAAGDFAKGRGVVNSNQSKNRLSAFYFDTKFNWQNSLLVDAGLRVEGSSRLGEEVRWGRFPYIAFTANLGQLDNFWARNKIQLRASYGITGNLPYTDYLSLRRYDSFSNAFYNGDFRPIYGIAYDSNPNLSWEKKRELNIGIGFQPTLFNKSISIGLEAYANTVNDLIQQVQNVLGRAVFVNIGRIKNRGLEARVTTELWRQRNRNWHTSLVLSSNNSTLDNYAGRRFFFFGLPEQRSPNFPAGGGCCQVNSVLLEDGSTIGDLLLLKAQGISPTGEWIFEDIDRNGVLDELRDKTVVGNGLPNWTLGWSNTFHFGNFQMDLFFRGAFGHDVFNVTRMLTENPVVISAYNVLATAFEGESARLRDAPQASSYYVENASFIRLDNVQLSYTLNTVPKLPFHSLQFYIAANNVFTISNYQGWDPDFRLQNENDVLSIGYEFRNLYLPTKSITFGLKTNFK